MSKERKRNTNVAEQIPLEYLEPFEEIAQSRPKLYSSPLDAYQSWLRTMEYIERLEKSAAEHRRVGPFPSEMDLVQNYIQNSVGMDIEVD